MAAVLVLDGGLSNALADRGHDLSGALWTARLLREQPAEIAAVHRAYFAAGARVATTASYQLSVEGSAAVGLDAGEARDLLGRSVRIARDVRDEIADDGIERFVAASVGPYGAVLADGSEYRGRYGVPAARLREFHGPRLEALVAAGPDLLAIETIPDVEEAVVLTGLLAEVSVPAWFSVSTLDGTHTAAGQPLAEAFAAAASAANVRAVGVNCCRPEVVRPALEVAQSVTGRPGVAYPNRGETWDARERRWTGAGAFDPSLAQDWVATGARYVGGCCGVGPADIAGLAAELTRSG